MHLVRWIYNLQWRHGYLLLLGIFLYFWRLAVVRLIPMLGSHPGFESFAQGLSLLWIPSCALAILHALSFVLRSLNTAEAVAKTALLSSIILALYLFVAVNPVEVVVDPKIAEARAAQHDRALKLDLVSRRQDVNDSTTQVVTIPADL
jgi:hypothetical protein